MYEIDYVFDEMSLFHIEELFNISDLQDSPTRLATGKDVKISPDLTVQSGKNQVAGVVFRDLKWTRPTQKSNFMLRDMQKKYGEDIKLHTWYFLKYTTGSFVREHMHNLFPTSWSTITMLSEPDEYTGGELVIHTRNNEEEIILEEMIEILSPMEIDQNMDLIFLTMKIFNEKCQVEIIIMRQN